MSKIDQKAKMLEQLGLGSVNEAPKPLKRTVRCQGSPSSKVILLVDDEPEFGEVTAVYFEDTEFDLLYVETVEEARHILNSRTQLSLVMTDLGMPIEDGFVLLRYLRDNPRFKQTPVIVSSSRSDKTTVVSALEAGAQEYILKPYSREALLAKVRLVLERNSRVILIASDCSATIHVFTRALTADGFIVLQVPTGGEALARLTQGGVDAVISDLVLEDMTGLDLMAKAQQVCPGFPFIFIEDVGTRIPVSAVLSAGGFGLLQKPFNNLELVRLTRQICELNK